MVTDYEKAIKEYGFTVVDGVKYAIGERPDIDNYSDGTNTRVAYVAYGFSEDMLYENGTHDPLFGETVTLLWDCNEWHKSKSTDEFDCDWENDAIIK